MNTKRVETKVYTEHLYCECGGEMRQTSAQIDEFGTGVLASVATWPPTYYHYCDKCDRREPLHETYPRIVYEEVEAEE